MEQQGEKPVVSVIVPVYGVEQYLEKSVSSIVDQTYQALDIVLVDDGSPDNCPALCDAWAERDNRIRVVHKVNGGLGSARNAGLDIAYGTYVCFIDSDDYIEPDMIETMTRQALSHQAQMVICGTINERYDCGKYSLLGTNTMTFAATECNDEVKSLIPTLMQSSYCIPAWNKLYWKAFLDECKARFDETVNVGEDSLFNVSLYTNLDRLVCIPDAAYHYISRSGSLCNRFNPRWFIDRRKLYAHERVLLRDWSDQALNLFANEFVFQTGVILSFLYEDCSKETKRLRRAMIQTIADDELVKQVCREIQTAGLRNEITKRVLDTNNPLILSAYGWAVAFVKRIRGGR
ncbi:glycosyl transferase family 2 [Bifidobacterium lemurum]|uniref:Glycosyl transferase family 2 n=1 Tax=Bifidobacterium lemurum TaxID=1603886 RepID=A0A261FQ69_9BIFI|nr:glycosyltransferase [Bifidobacterium lemurum]OZG61331.1 glycosyl transferase family 2 [Bifidobacterium lemurum]QOL34719.1 glycosyltransferase family 2 protein [Bifidobacterium lemurum]